MKRRIPLVIVLVVVMAAVIYYFAAARRGREIVLTGFKAGCRNFWSAKATR